MKKFLFILLAALTIVSCQKRDGESLPVTQEVSFKALEVNPDGGLKSTGFDCKDEVPTHASVRIGIGQEPNIVYTNYYPQLFTLDGILYTQAIKLPSGEYFVSNFVLYKDVDGVDGLNSTDIVVFATPNATSEYGVYVDYPLPYDFDVLEFQKIEVPIQVLCFEDAEYDSFGFDWFQITEIVIRELCFFGDICLSDPPLIAEWWNSIYALQENGIQVDMPAIFFINIKDKDGNSVPYSPWSNEGSWGNVGHIGEGAPLCVAYPDNLMIDGEVFTLEFYLYGPVDDDESPFGYTLYDTWVIIDDKIYDTDDPAGIGEDTPVLPIGDQGVYEFVVGDCVNNPPGIYFPPYDPQDPPNPPVVENCKTAYAYNETYSTCFLAIPNTQGENWGWTNGLLYENNKYSFNMYAGAAHCEWETKGTLVGILDVDYQLNGVVVVKYTMISGFKLSEVDIWVGSDLLPKKTNGPQPRPYLTAPGQFTWNDMDINMLITYTHTFTDMPEDGIYVAAHAVVCGVYN